MTNLTKEDRERLFEESFNAVVKSDSEQQLHERVMRYAEAVGYSVVVDLNSDEWEYGRHAERALEEGLPAAAQLFRMAWKISLHVQDWSSHNGKDKEENKRLISEEFRDQQLFFSGSKNSFFSDIHGWGSIASASFFNKSEIEGFASLPRWNGTGSDSVWMTPLQAEDRLMSDPEQKVSIEAHVRALAAKRGWTQEELTHALSAPPVEIDGECIIKMANGRELLVASFPEPCNYVMLVDQGIELAYWTDDEWRDDPQEVMGAIMGAANGRSNALPPAERARFMREQAADLLRQAESLDGMHAFAVTHTHKFGASTYITWDHIPSLTEERAASACEGNYDSDTDMLYIDDLSIDELTGLKNVQPPHPWKASDVEEMTP